MYYVRLLEFFTDSGIFLKFKFYDLIDKARVRAVWDVCEMSGISPLSQLFMLAALQ